MKSMRPPSAAIFLMTYFHRARGGPWPPRPPPGSATGPQTKFAKVMFSQGFVCPHGGRVCNRGGGSASGGGKSASRWGLHPDVGLHPDGGLYPGGSTSREGLHPGGRGSTSKGSVSKGSTSRRVGQTTIHTLGYYGMQSTSGRDASYWNAFLFIYLFCWGCLRNAKPINCHFQCITSKFP